MESHSSSGRKNKASKGHDTCKGTSSSRNGVELITLDDDCPTELITNPGGVLRKKPLPTAENQRREWREAQVSPGAHQESNARPEPDRDNTLDDILEMGNQETRHPAKKPILRIRQERVEELRKKRLHLSELADSEFPKYLKTLFYTRDLSARQRLFHVMSLDHLETISELLRSQDQQDAGNLMECIHDIAMSWSQSMHRIQEFGQEEEKEDGSS